MSAVNIEDELAVYQKLLKSHESMSREDLADKCARTETYLRMIVEHGEFKDWSKDLDEMLERG